MRRRPPPRLPDPRGPCDQPGRGNTEGNGGQFVKGELAQTAVLAFAAFATAASAGDIPFDGAWREQRFPFKRPNNWILEGSRLGLESDGDVSLVYRQLEAEFRQAGRASWRWNVEHSVPPTDLTRKGGDDRNLAVYFLFPPENEALRLSGASLKRVLGNRNARAIVYVHGGDHQLGQFLPSPYLGSRGVTIQLQDAAPGSDEQSVDIRNDFRRAFKEEAGVLFGIAISADSDDTSSNIGNYMAV
ncbi:DUF3047 domain-containing protein [Tropicimonas sp. TH_r6]|uniref:DUF3047 domain-containing protein n=1 Tax=Tropicimonas sp. TH_r6 TaxID=3082085 RepID=UPI00295575AA|nr:DUF3047 domain-containing protein [Tropicimonas sp. TH_r6]MDV7142967.1 DUF3047 domain-containing protein [Tropicimonas sp. TH_r6]